MAEFPILPVDTDRLIADCGYMSNEEFGLYFRLLMLIWRTPGCRVPNDSAWLCKKLSIPHEHYESQLKPIVDEFCISTGNWLSQKRLKAVNSKVRDKVKKATEAANTRWGNEKSPSERNAIKIKIKNNNPPTPKGEGAIAVWKGIGPHLDHDDSIRTKARQAAPGYDLQYLIREYDSWVADKEKPRKPGPAFVAWCAALYKKRGPA